MYVADVLTISFTPEAKVLEVDDCHFRIEPVYPDNVSVELFTPAHLEVDPKIEPPTDRGLTVIVPVAFTEPQPPIKGIL